MTKVSQDQNNVQEPPKVAVASPSLSHSSPRKSEYFTKTPSRAPNKAPRISKTAHQPITSSTNAPSQLPLPGKDPTNETWDPGSTDSTLSDPPSDLESPFPGNDPLISAALSSIHIKTPKKKRNQTTSPYFPKKPRRPVSCLPFPSTTTETFGLMQEKLAHDPFRLIVATIFLNRTRGEQAMPVYYQLMEQYPTVEALSNAQVPDLVAMIHKLGFQNQRARKCIELAKAWLDRPPEKGKRHRKIDYPKKGDGRDIGVDEVIDDEDSRVGWEIGGLPGVGAYALDSWRIFCRDTLREIPEASQSKANKGYEPEWTRVLPTDKELRAYLSWMWLKRGIIWNKETGARTEADSKTLDKGAKGGIVREIGDSWILESPIKNLTTSGLEVMKPAGEFLPVGEDSSSLA